MQREANKIAQVLRRLGHRVTVENFGRADPTLSVDYNIFVGTFERRSVERFDSAPKTLFYLAMEGVHNLNDYRPRHPIVAPSGFSREMLEASGYRVEAVVHHGFDLSWFNPPTTPPTTPTPTPTPPRVDSRVWLLFKRWTPRQRVDLIVESLKLLKDRYNIVGVGLLDLSQPPIAHLLADRYPVAEYPNTTFDDDFVAASYKASDLYIHLSTNEGFGLTPLEALGFGTPTIYADAPPMNEVLPRSYGYRVPVEEEVWLPCDEYTYKLFVFDPNTAADALFAAYEHRNHAVDRDYIRNFDMFKLYTKLLEWA